MKNNYKIVLSIFVLMMFIVTVSAFWPFNSKAPITGDAVSSPPTTVTSCSDTEATTDNMVAGTISYSYKEGFRTRSGSMADTCSGATVIEYSCDGTTKTKSERIACANGCSDGKCNAVTDPVPEGQVTCRDSEGSTSTAQVGGVVIGSDSKGTYTILDTCQDGVLVEAKCNANNVGTVSRVKCKGTNVGVCTTKTITFEGSSYEAGSCDPQPLACTDGDTTTDAVKTVEEQSLVSSSVTSTDATGKTTDNSDKCTDRKKLREYTCTADNKLNYTDVTCSDICVDGKCVDRASLCSDTDNGRDLAVTGTVTNKFNNTITGQLETLSTVSDFCAGPRTIAEFACAKKASNGNLVMAGSSKVLARITVDYVTCPRGKICREGACIPSNIATIETLEP